MAIEDVNLEKRETDESEADFLGRLSLVLHEIYPVLVDRLRTARFAQWHKRTGELDELAQKASLQFLKHWSRRKEMPEKALNYIVAIAKNIARKEYAKSREFLELVVPITEDFPAIFDDNVDDENEPAFNDSNVERLRRALDMLGPRQRRAFQLRNENPGDTDRELGNQMGITEDGFRKNYGRALANLQSMLRKKQ